MNTENESKYRKYLIKCLTTMEEIHNSLQNCLINLAMSGELKDVDDCFEEGDAVTFKRSDFENLADQNIKILVPVLDSLFAAFESIKNVNAISTEEIRESYLEWEYEQEGIVDDDKPINEVENEDDDLPFFTESLLFEERFQQIQQLVDDYCADKMEFDELKKQVSEEDFEMWSLEANRRNDRKVSDYFKDKEE